MTVSHCSFRQVHCSLRQSFWQTQDWSLPKWKQWAEKFVYTLYLLPLSWKTTYCSKVLISTSKLLAFCKQGRRQCLASLTWDLLWSEPGLSPPAGSSLPPWSSSEICRDIFRASLVTVIQFSWGLKKKDKQTFFVVRTGWGQLRLLGKKCFSPPPVMKDNLDFSYSFPCWQETFQPPAAPLGLLQSHHTLTQCRLTRDNGRVWAVTRRSPFHQLAQIRPLLAAIIPAALHQSKGLGK